MEQNIFSWWFAKRVAGLAMAAALFGCVLSAVLVAADRGNVGEAAWAAPRHMTLKRIGPTSTRRNTPVLFSNMDCTSVTYRLVARHDMKTGCFIQTAYGMFDSGSYTVIFNGTDEGLPLEPYSAHQIPVPWPNAGEMLALSPLSTGGALIGLYKSPLSAMQDHRDTLGRLTAKKLATPPDLTLKDPAGGPLVVNPQTLAFSQGGGWLAVETLSGSFVRVDLNALGARPFARAYGSTGSPALLKSQVAVRGNGRWVAIANDYAGEFKVYDLSDCGAPDKYDWHDLPPLDCESYDYHQFIASQIPGLRSVRRLRFVNDGLLSFEATSSDSSQSGAYELAPTASIKFLTEYIGLGDSYTSGEGAFDYLPGTDTPDNTCHLSVNSYPLLLARDLFGAAGGHSAACSGAVIKDIGSTSGRYKGQAKGGASLDELRSRPQALEAIEAGFLPGYIAQHRFVRRWQPRVATVSIAGNDIGFGDILRNCVEPHVSLRKDGNTCYSTYEDRLELKNLVDRTVPRWKALFTRLQSEAPDTRLYVIGYPQIALAGGNCALNVQLDSSELELAAELIDYINNNVEKAAGESGATYTDISRALYGHRLCEAKGYDVAMNGLTAGNDFGAAGVGLVGRESYHPNALGHELMEQSILRQTHNLTKGGQDARKSGASALLNAPKTGRTVYVLVPDGNLAPEAGRRQSVIQLRANGMEDGLRPDSMYEIHLDSPSGKVLGKAVSDGSGNVKSSVRIPANTAPGGHRIDLTGENRSGAPIDVTSPFYVRASDADSDGDGIDDILDSCPGAINSGRDRDHDGMDDICDSLAVPPGAGSGIRERHKKQTIKAAAGTARVLGATAKGDSGSRPVHGTVRTVSNGQYAQYARSGPALAWAAISVILGFLLFAAGKINKTRRSGLQ